MTTIANQRPYDRSSDLSYDQMNDIIYNLNDTSSDEDYSHFENIASLSLIAEDEKCKKCKSHYTFIICSNCKRETCANNKCCTLYPDMYGYISICKKCEKQIVKKFKPYDDNEEVKYNKEYKKAVKELHLLKLITQIIY